MEFSKKLQQLPPQFFAALVGKVNAALAQGRDVINLGQGNPDQPTPNHIIEALQFAATLSDNDFSIYYPQTFPSRGCNHPYKPMSNRTYFPAT